MKMVRSVTASAIGLAMLATSVTPAAAQVYPGYPGGYPGGDYRRHHDGPSIGGVIAGVAIIGAIAAIASSASKSNRGYDPRYGDRDRDDGYGDGYGVNSERDAASACATAVERRYGRDAQVRNIDSVYRTRDGYEVRGTVSTGGYDSRWGNGGYDDRYGRNTDQFSCSVRYGRVDRVELGRDSAQRGW